MKIKIPSELVLEYMRRTLTYNPITGEIIKNGKPCGVRHIYRRKTYIKLQLVLDTKYEGCCLHYSVPTHQVAWYLNTGKWPTMLIDHIDGDGANNQWSNLRLADYRQNGQNSQKTKKPTSSRFKGVQRRGNKYRAYINVKGKRLSLGTYSTEVAAAQAYNIKAQEVYGAYACLNDLTMLGDG